MKLSEIADIARGDIIAVIDALDRAALRALAAEQSAAAEGNRDAISIWRDRKLALRQAATALYADLKAHSPHS